jgi:hypothetical protein
MSVYPFHLGRPVHNRVFRRQRHVSVYGQWCIWNNFSRIVNGGNICTFDFEILTLNSRRFRFSRCYFGRPSAKWWSNDLWMTKYYSWSIDHVAAPLLIPCNTLANSNDCLLTVVVVVIDHVKSEQLLSVVLVQLRLRLIDRRHSDCVDCYVRWKYSKRIRANVFVALLAFKSTSP